jgi:hypothetical protein
VNTITACARPALCPRPARADGRETGLTRSRIRSSSRSALSGRGRGIRAEPARSLREPHRRVLGETSYRAAIRQQRQDREALLDLAGNYAEDSDEQDDSRPCIGTNRRDVSRISRSHRQGATEVGVKDQPVSQVRFLPGAPHHVVFRVILDIAASPDPRQEILTLPPRPPSPWRGLVPCRRSLRGSRRTDSAGRSPGAPCRPR